MGENTVKTIWRHWPLINRPLIRRFHLSWPEWCMMGPGGRRPDTYQYVYPHLYTPHTDTVSHLFFLLVLHRGSVLDFPFPPLSLNQKKRHCLSLPLVFCVRADTHTHAQTHTHAHKYSTCTDTQTPAPTETRTHTQPAFCCCDGSELSKHPRFLSLSLTKAAWLSLSMQVLRDCCLSALTLSFCPSPSSSSLYRQHLSTLWFCLLYLVLSRLYLWRFKRIHACGCCMLIPRCFISHDTWMKCMCGCFK